MVCGSQLPVQHKDAYRIHEDALPVWQMSDDAAVEEKLTSDFWLANWESCSNQNGRKRETREAAQILKSVSNDLAFPVHVMFAETANSKLAGQNCSIYCREI